VTGPARLLAVAVLLVPWPAAAQQAGTYVGTLANGDPISVTVSADPYGPSVVTGLTIEPTAPIHCTPHPARLDTVLDVGGTFVVVGGNVDVAVNSSFEIMDAPMSFTATTLTGTVSLTRPVFTKYERMPFNVAMCVMPKTRFSATLSAGQ
jgi:hypothetical protein